MPPTDCSCLQEHPTSPVYLTGHSLGGGQALVAGGDLPAAYPGSSFTIYAMAPYRQSDEAWNTAVLAQPNLLNVWRINHRYDEVPARHDAWGDGTDEAWTYAGLGREVRELNAVFFEFFYWQCRKSKEFPLKNDGFVLKNCRLLLQLRFGTPTTTMIPSWSVTRAVRIQPCSTPSTRRCGITKITTTTSATTWCARFDYTFSHYQPMGVWIYGRMDLWAYGPMGVWIYGHMGLWIYGRMDLWAYGPMGVWI